MVEPRGGSDVPYPKKENPTPDPYEFNAKVEDGFGIPIKKIKVEKVEAACSPMQPEVHDIGIDTCSVGVITEPECLGPCEPGTSVTLEGIVWHETENAGVLVINVTWRGKTYVGTLLDATKHDWAPPRFNCDSPVSDLESRTPKGRGKRGRGNAATPVNERVNNNNSNNSNSSNANNSNNSNNEGRKLRKGRRCGGNSFQAPPSPAKQEHDRSSSLKRKGRPSDLDLSVPPDSSKGSKRCRSSSRGASAATNNQNTSSTSGNGTSVTVVSSNCSTPGESTSPGLLTCPEANCNKQYKHINGLRYHQSHAHHNAMLQAQAAEENLRDDNGASMEENATDEEIARVRKDESSETPSGKGSRTVKIKEESMSDDNIPADCSLSTEQQSDAASICPPTSADDSDAQKCVLDKVPNIKIEPCLENLKTEKVTIKTEHHSSSSGPVPPTAAGHTVSSVSKQSLTTQIYQLAAAPMGCLGSGSVAMVTQPNCQINPLTTVTTSSTTSPVSSQPLPITVSAMGPISHVSESEKGMKTDKSSVLDKSKVKTPTRPIVPAPTPQVVAFAGGISSNHPSLTSVPNTHSQVSPSLKPIQPKPTILGEPMNINPALVGLKDKKAKQKKKCKEKDGVKPGELGPMKGDIPKYERTAVIKAVASPPKPGMELSMKKEGGSLMEPPHLTSDLSRPGAGSLGCGNSVIASSQVSPKSIDPSHIARMAQPPGLLKVGPSGLLSTPERKTPVNDDVQSPAYSDISDANESGSPSQGDTPVKVKEEASTSRKQEKHTNQNPSDQAAAPVPHYSMYGYYGQSSYLIPNVTQASSSSPHVSQGGSSVSNSGSGTTVSNHKTPNSAKGDLSSNSSNPAPAASSHEEKVSISIDEGIKINEEKKIKEEKEDPKHKEGAPPGGGGGGGGGSGSGGPSGGGGASGQVLPPPEYPQKLFPQYYWPQHNTYQYPYGYMEPYAMHFPQYRQYEKVLEDQKRLQQQQHHQIKELEPVKKPGDYHSKSGLPDESKGPPHSDLPPAMRPIKSSSHGIALKATPADKMTDSHKLVVEKSLERDREQALREKQNENHQILKESIELKPQMDKSRYEMSNLDPYRIHDEIRHSEEMQRYYMFNQQKLIGQEKQKDMQSMESMIPKTSSHKSAEHSRMHSEDIHAREANNSSNNSGGGGPSSHNPSKRDLSDNKNKELVRDINVLGKSMPSDMKSDDKQRVMVMDRMRSPADSQKLKGSYSSSLSVSSIPGGSNSSSSSNISSSPSTNSGSSSSNMTTTTTTTTTTVASTGSANYPHYLSYPYVQTPAYGQLHFDPYRPFNLGYANPSYLHPTHLAYRVNPNEPEKEEKIPNPPKTLLNQPVISGSELESFKSSEVIHHSPSTPYFGVHKMHELQEKPLSSSRPSPSSSSNCRSSPHTKSSISETSVSPSPNFEKSRDYQNSPPTQRHVHTHHHTHVVGATFPLYPPFTNK